MDYFDINLSLTWEDTALQNAAHEFAAEVMRPIAKQLDRMPPEEAVAPGSPLWVFLRKAYELGYHKAFLPAAHGGLGLAPTQICVVQEELAWGSFGLARLLGASSLPFQAAWLTGDQDLIDTFGNPFGECAEPTLIGCWAATELDRGTDSPGNGEVQARLDSDEWVINGQMTARIAGAKTATHAFLFAQMDPSDESAGRGACIVPLDRAGVRRGKALNKIGMRDLNQAELLFDDVRIPKKWMLIGTEACDRAHQSLLVQSNVGMSIWATGLCRAAFDESLQYAKERVQGGKPLVEHSTMKQRLFEMFARVETSRALARAAANLNLSLAAPFSEYSMAAKTTCTRLALENAHDAIQIFGGNGLTQEYPMEKLFRDARAAQILGGSNEVLAEQGGHTVTQHHPRARSDIRVFPWMTEQGA